MKYKKYKGMENEVKEDERPIIMIVDDEPGILKELETLLSKNYKVITALNGQEALEKLYREENPEEISLIICDQRMPRMTGVELLKYLAKEQIMPDTVRIVLTAFDDKEVILDAINDAHIYKFIMKPYDPDGLLLDVQRTVEAFYDRQDLKQCKYDLGERIAEIAKLKKKLKNLRVKYNALRRK